MGPGKAELLEQVHKTGSIAEAAEKMEMSYMRAWQLIKTMERCFNEPLVIRHRGGAKRGGAELSETGLRILELYRELEARSLEANNQIWGELSGLLKD